MSTQLEKQLEKYTDTEKVEIFIRYMGGEETLQTEVYANNPSTAPFNEACRATMKRAEAKFKPGNQKLHYKALREELLLRANDIREEHALREKTIQNEIDRLIKEKGFLTNQKEFFEKNILERQ